jgi:DNA repair protein RadC
LTSATAWVAVHNHPSGVPEPSKEDVEITRRLKDVGELLGIRLLDHIIIGTDRYVSFSEDGYF